MGVGTWGRGVVKSFRSIRAGVSVEQASSGKRERKIPRHFLTRLVPFIGSTLKFIGAIASLGLTCVSVFVEIHQSLQCKIFQYNFLG